MRDRLIVAGLFVLGLAVLGGYYVNATRASDPGPYEPVIAGEGPVMAIEVAGEAEGTIRIQLRADVAPEHVERVVTLAERGDYDGVVFHRVIDGFMAQTGDVQHGQVGGDLRRAGTGGSDLPNLPAEFSDLPFERGVMGMARSQHPDSANSQFFLMFAAAPHLNREYTALGQIIDGIEVLDAIKRGTGPNGAVQGTPDAMARVTIER